MRRLVFVCDHAVRRKNSDVLTSRLEWKPLLRSTFVNLSRPTAVIFALNLPRVRNPHNPRPTFIMETEICSFAASRLFADSQPCIHVKGIRRLAVRFDTVYWQRYMHQGFVHGPPRICQVGKTVRMKGNIHECQGKFTGEEKS